jgi:methylated-DNA-[protein]-cysteine S-methyltransferase
MMPVAPLADLPLSYSYLDTPIGPLLLVGDDAGLRGVQFAGLPSAPAPPLAWTGDDAPFAAARSQLTQYFAGERAAFDLALAPTGTPFQLAAWAELRRIPYGEPASYREIAERLGRPTATRAVGAANGANPLPVVVPCHRVIGSDGSLTGFGGGLERKVWLLAHEGHAVPAASSSRSRVARPTEEAPSLPFPEPVEGSLTTGG